MKILALEPFYGGSHRYFIDGLMVGSQHDWSLYSLPDSAWRWRMRHSAVYFAEKIRGDTNDYDLIFCTSMVNIAELKGLLPERLRDVPVVVYFHENQATYPVYGSEPSTGALMDNFVSALSAEQVWFNSEWNRQSLLNGLFAFFKKVPDNSPADQLELIHEKSHIMPLWVMCSGHQVDVPKPGPLHILWSARWERDKNPHDFFRALRILKNRKVDFRLSVLGECPDSYPPIFDHAREMFADNIMHWGYKNSRDKYFEAIAEADIMVSTSEHEFFGISVLEAAACGVRPVLPKRLSYPEIFIDDRKRLLEDYFYGNDSGELADCLEKLAALKDLDGNVCISLKIKPDDVAERYSARRLILSYDNAFTTVVQS